MLVNDPIRIPCEIVFLIRSWSSLFFACDYEIEIPHDKQLVKVFKMLQIMHPNRHPITIRSQLFLTISLLEGKLSSHNKHGREIQDVYANLTNHMMHCVVAK